ncbi:hypothetical protein [Corynebacterium sputi]|uniref:hypothetical protein n=1 Tax=Corynebacterium sputi TaxID=489915 RepID=UPI000408A970|nr:hypothetical protein [Corynebacterium sputi]
MEPTSSDRQSSEPEDLLTEEIAATDVPEQDGVLAEEPENSNLRSERRPLVPGILAALMVVPLIVGAVLVGSGTVNLWGGPAGSSVEQSDGAAAGSSPHGQAQTALQEAAAQSGLLVSGLEQGSEGVGEIRTGTGELADGLVELQEGARQLVEATQELSTGLDDASGGLPLLAAATGQINGAIDRSRESLQASNSPDAQAAIGDLDSLQRQLGLINFEDLAADLQNASSGAQEIAAESGTALTNGLNDATEGSEVLLEAMDELQGGIDRLEGMATSGNEEIATARSALGDVSDAEFAAAAGTVDATEAAQRTVVVLLFFMMGAAALLWLLPVNQTARALGAVIAVGTVTLLVVTPGFTVATGLLAVLFVAVAAIASAAVAGVLFKVLDRRWGIIAIGTAMLIQVIYLGVFLRTSLAEIPAIVSALMPLTYPSAGISSLLNDASLIPFTTTITLTALLGALGIASIWVGRRSELKAELAQEEEQEQEHEEEDEQLVSVAANAETPDGEDGSADGENQEHDERSGGDSDPRESH